MREHASKQVASKQVNSNSDGKLRCPQCNRSISSKNYDQHVKVRCKNAPASAERTAYLKQQKEKREAANSNAPVSQIGTRRKLTEKEQLVWNAFRSMPGRHSDDAAWEAFHQFERDCAADERREKLEAQRRAKASPIALFWEDNPATFIWIIGIAAMVIVMFAMAVTYDGSNRNSNGRSANKYCKESGCTSLASGFWNAGTGYCNYHADERRKFYNAVLNK